MEREIITCRYLSPCGPLLLGAVGGRLCMCDWISGRRHAGNVLRLLRSLKATEMREAQARVLDEARRQLDAYFERGLRELSVPLLMTGTPFQMRVWRELRSIPYGMTVSYGEVARNVGCPRAVRAVAGAIGANPISLFAPCHRVTGRDNSLTGYAGGLEAKAWLLDFELGVRS